MRFLFLNKKESEAVVNVSRGVKNKDENAINEMTAIAKLSVKWRIKYVDVIKKLQGMGLVILIVTGIFDNNSDDIRVHRVRARTQITRVRRREGEV